MRPASLYIGMTSEHAGIEDAEPVPLCPRHVSPRCWSTTPAELTIGVPQVDATIACASVGPRSRPFPRSHARSAPPRRASTRASLRLPRPRRPDGGGSEEHASQVAPTWRGRAARSLHTGRVKGGPARGQARRHRVVRRAAAWGCSRPLRSTSAGRLGPGDGIIEIFHGVPFFARCGRAAPQVGVVHHVHLGTWDMLLPGPFAPLGHAVERHLVPLVYRGRTLLTAAPSARDEIVEHYRRRPRPRRHRSPRHRRRFRPGGDRAASPLVVAVARLMPQKGISDLLPGASSPREPMSPTSRPSSSATVRTARASRPRAAPSAATAGSASPGAPPTRSWSTGTAGLGRAQRLHARGLRAHPHRGGRVRHTGGRHADPGPRRRGRRGSQRAARHRRRRAGRRLARLLLDDELRGQDGRRPRIEHAESFRWEASTRALFARPRRRPARPSMTAPR